MTNDYEILAPCGSLESVYAAAASGCDSIYIGAKQFNARAYADSPDTEELKKAIDYCHLRGIRVYITFNILYKQKEIPDLLKLASRLYSFGADAFITADIGIFNVFRQYFGGIKLNVSTQAGVHNSDTALCMKALGADRIILSRELNTKDIKAIHSKLGEYPDLEAFVHGALCVCYSGRCLFSSFIGGRSGNRGRCAQPCRMEYTLYKNGVKTASGPLLSPKDIMTADKLYSLIDAGVKAFKIEGRMKGIPYVAKTVKTYKKQLRLALENKEDSKISETDRKELLQVFSRGGEFSGGYISAPKGRDMMSDFVKHTGREIGKVIKSEKNGCIVRFYEDLDCGDGIEVITGAKTNPGANISKKIDKNREVFLKLSAKKGDRVFLSKDKSLSDRLIKEAAETERKITASAYFYAYPSKPISLILKADRASAEVRGKAPEPAANIPATRSEIIKRLSKTGGTPFSLEIKELKYAEGIYIPIKELNDLRRRACELLSENIIKSYERPLPSYPCAPQTEKNEKKPILCAEVSTYEQLKAALASPVERIYIDEPQLVKKVLGNDKEIYFALPQIIREDMLESVFSLLKQLDKTEISGYLIRNLTAYKTDKKIICDHTLGVFNTFTAEKLLSMYDGITLSTELDPSELKELCGKNTEIIVYGRLPLMVTEQCPIGNFAANNRAGRFCSLKNSSDGFILKDRMGKLYPIKRHCESCMAEILSCEPLSALNSYKEITVLKPSSFRMIFTTETAEETKSVIMQHYKALIENKKTKYPKGHALKGVM